MACNEFLNGLIDLGAALIKMECTADLEWLYPSAFHFPAAAAVPYGLCGREGFTFLDFRKWKRWWAGGVGCLRLSDRPLKKTPRERRWKWLSEQRKEKQTRSSQRRTMRLLTRPFWGAYVGHGMNKQTRTELNPDLHTAMSRCLCSPFYNHTSVTYHSFKDPQRQSQVVLCSLFMPLHSTPLWTWPLLCFPLKNMASPRQNICLGFFSHMHCPRANFFATHFSKWVWTTILFTTSFGYTLLNIVYCVMNAEQLIVISVHLKVSFSDKKK